MTFNLTTLVGLLASSLTALSLLPQLIKIVKEKKAGDISLLMLVILFAGIAGWIWYGALKEDWIIIIANSISIVINSVIVVLTIKYSKKHYL